MVTAIAAVVAIVESCLGIMGWLFGTWKADVAPRESRTSDAVNLAMISTEV